MNDDPVHPQADIGEEKKDGKDSKKNLKIMENKESKLKMHPVTAIPQLLDELFLHILRFLHTRQIAVCTAVSKEWRRQITVNSSLYADLFLLFLGRRYEAEPFLNLFDRLSSLSHNRLRSVEIDITHFYLECRTASKRIDAYAKSFLPKLMATLIKSKHTLTHLLLKVDDKILTPKLISSVLLQLKSFPALRKVTFDACVAISLKSESHSDDCREEEGALWKGCSKGCKSLEVLGRRHRHHDFKFSDVEPLLRIAEGFFSNASFRHLTILPILPKDASFDRNSSLSITTLLQHSKYNLKILQVGRVEVGAREIWGFAMECFNLQSLALELHSNEPNTIHLNAPEHRTTSNLTSFKLICSGDFFVQWKHMVNFLGSKLISLHVVEETNGSLMRDSIGLSSAIANSRESIWIIKLRGHQECGTAEAEDSEIDPTSLPNLRSLYLSKLSSSSYSFFKNSVYSSRFIELHMFCRYLQGDFDCLLALLERNSSTLTNLTIIVSGLSADTPMPPPSEQLQFCFSDLEMVSFGRNRHSAAVATWFSGLARYFPQLGRVDLSLEHQRSIFMDKSPLLRFKDSRR